MVYICFGFVFEKKKRKPENKRTYGWSPRKMNMICEEMENRKGQSQIRICEKCLINNKKFNIY